MPFYSIDLVVRAHRQIKTYCPRLEGAHWVKYLDYLSYYRAITVSMDYNKIVKFRCLSYSASVAVAQWAPGEDIDVLVRTWVSRALPYSVTDPDYPSTLYEYRPTHSRHWWETFRRLAYVGACFTIERGQWKMNGESVPQNSFNEVVFDALIPRIRTTVDAEYPD